MSSGKWSLEQMPRWTDERGTLVALERGHGVPFAIERVYYLYGAPGDAERGFHAHRRLEQIAIAVSGSCTFLLDDGEQREEVRLDSPEVGLLMRPLVWHEMRDFSSDCVLLVLASGRFDAAEYIRDYQEFRRCVEGDSGS